MPLQKRTFRDFVNSIIGKFVKELPEVDPTIDASFAKTSVITSAIAGSNLQEGIEDAVEQMFWQTADDDFLETIGEYNHVSRNQPTAAAGFCSVEGVLSTIISAGTNLTGSNGLTYEMLTDAQVQEYTDTVTLTFSGGIVTAETDVEHSLATGLTVTITNATQTDYNGTYVITVIDENTFTYEITAGSLTSDQGNYSSTYASLNVECLETGQITNIAAGGTLSIDVVDINDVAYVQINEISGGTDLEDLEDYRERVGQANSATPGIATESSLVFSCKKVSGNTRVFIVRGSTSPSGTEGQAGYIPALGQTVIYILRDDDVSITPSQGILDLTKAQILEDRNWPTLTDIDNLFVLAPIVLEQDFTFSGLSPSTTNMQNAVRNRLVDYFRDNAQVGNPTFILELDEISAFLRTISDSTGARLLDITIDSPIGDIVANSGEIYTRGTVTFV